MLLKHRRSIYLLAGFQPAEPAEILISVSHGAQLRFLDTGSPCTPARSTARCYPKTEEVQVAKAPFKSMTIMPAFREIKEKHPEKSAYMQYRKAFFFFFFFEQTQPSERLNGHCKHIQPETRVLSRLASGRGRVKELTHFQSRRRAGTTSPCHRPTPPRVTQAGLCGDKDGFICTESERQTKRTARQHRCSSR